jgi:hypothetical protein
MVNIDSEEIVVRDFSRAAKVLVAIRLRELDQEKEENTDEPNLRLRASFN